MIYYSYSGITLDAIYQSFPWRNLWTAEKYREFSGVVTAEDYTGNDDVSTPASDNVPSFSTINKRPAFQYDGVDDYFVKNVSDWRSTDSEGLIVAVLEKVDVFTGFAEPILVKNRSTNNAIQFSFFVKSGEFYINANNGDTVNQIKFGSISANVPLIVTIKSNGINYIATVNGVSQVITVVSGSNNGLWIDYPLSIDQITSGALIQPTKRYAKIKCSFIGYLPSSVDENKVISMLNSYYQVY